MIADDIMLPRLMAMAQAGDKQAYATLLDYCYRWLKRYFSRRVVLHHLDDLVQDTLVSVHRKLESYDAERPFLPWLAAIARYRWIDYLRKVYRAGEVELDDHFAGTSDEPAISARISLEQLLALLPDGQIKAIELVKIEGLSVSEAAQMCGQSESLIKVNIHRGLRRLATLIEKA
jgi:RNA polymerase sigma factor (sigma-70 family)